MAGKEAQDKNSENILLKVAKMIGSSLLGVTPLMAAAQYDTLKDLTKLLDNKDWAAWCDKLVTGGFADQDTVDQLKEFADYPFPWGGIMLIMTILKVKLTDLQSILDIYGLDRQYDAQAKTTPHPAPADALIESMFIDPARTTENRAQLGRLGFDKTQIDNMILARYARVPLDVIRVNYLRGNIDSDTLYERMRELGFTDVRTAEIIKTWSLLPPPQDLFTMVAHEAFEPEIYNLIGLADEFPEEQVKWLQEQGISEAWARKYWIAHWDEPSIGQGFEMLHRGVIDYDTLNLLFKTVEIPRYWRDKLTKIAYQPLTRVDVRRMHDLGVIDDERLTKAYLDLGFSPEDALNMANFTIRYNQSANKDLSKAAVLSSYEDGLLTRSQALELLQDQGYDEDTADFYLTQSDYNREKALSDQLIENIKDRYLLDLISEADLRTELNRSGMTGDAVNTLIDTLRLDKYKYQALPSRSDLSRWYESGSITEDQFRTGMTRLGYAANHIQLYLDELLPEVATKYTNPSRTDVTNWLKKGEINRPLWDGYMRRLGYSDEDIQHFYNTK